MITIIKHGAVGQYEKTCPNCGCIFRFTDDDTTIFRAAEILQVIVCPDCNGPLLISKKEIKND